MEVRILTGVLHQVRAHLAAIGAPLVGDALYGGRASPAWAASSCTPRARAPHPATGARIEVVAPLPDELRRSLALGLDGVD